MPTRSIISSYAQPIIMGLTPWSQTRVAIDPLKAKSDWPPNVDSERLAVYELYDALIENRHQDIFDDLKPKLSADQASKIALAVALPELLSNVWADSVWSDPPTIEFESDAVEARWQAIDEANSFTEIGAWESVFAAAGWGTSVIRMYRDEDRATAEGADSDVYFEEVSPAIFFPKLRAGSARIVEYIVLAWTEDRSGPDDDRQDIWQVREVHDLDNGTYRIRRGERRETTTNEAFNVVSDELVAGVDFLPFSVMHAGRWRGRYWGVSELSRAVPLFDEIDNTVSNIAEILEYHGKPVLQVPASVIYGGTLFKGADKAIGIRTPEEANVARYITYDGQLSAQMASLDKNLELLFLTAEVPGRYFGLGPEGTAASGVAFKLELQNYLKKAGRWQARETLRFKDLSQMAIKLDGKVTMAKPPQITHGSPLPADDEAEARIESGLVTAGLASQRGAITRLRRAKDVDEEIAEIEADKQASIANATAAFGTPAPNSSTDPNADARTNPPA